MMKVHYIHVWTHNNRNYYFVQLIYTNKEPTVKLQPRVTPRRWLISLPGLATENMDCFLDLYEVSTHRENLFLPSFLHFSLPLMIVEPFSTLWLEMELHFCFLFSFGMTSFGKQVCFYTNA